MKERPILFQGAMVRALLAGTKTQTRRAAPIERMDIKPHGEDTLTWGVHFSKPIKGTISSHSGGRFSDLQARQIIASQFCPYGQPGDRLWVRETWQGPLLEDFEVDADAEWMSPERIHQYRNPAHCQYAADGGAAPEFMDADDNLQCRWRPSIHMNRWASRITLEITDVRVERLQDISEADAIAEGLTPQHGGGWGLPAGEHFHSYDPRISYWSLWDAINGPGSTEANPWVWAVTFQATEGATQ